MAIGLSITILLIGIAFLITILKCKKSKKFLLSEIEKKKDSIKTKLIEIKEIKSDNEDLKTTITEKDIFLENNKQEIIELKSELKRFENISSIEKELIGKNSELTKLEKTLNELNIKYVNSKTIYKDLKKEINLYSNQLYLMDFGIYEPIFDFDTSEKYKNKILHNKNKQKKIIQSDNAIRSLVNWSVEGSEAKGKQMIKRQSKLMLRAFNGESDALITKVKWNNFDSISNRISKSFDAVTNSGNSNHIHLEPELLKLKFEELRLTHEYQIKKQQEKEEARAIRAEQREEERAQREFENARKEAEIEEKRFQKALEKAKKDLGLVSGEKLDELNSQIALLEQNLKEANEAKERAISRAQETKSGHVYIISNLGSFGDNIYKIGMTRRLEPMDRVKELGDASVPFTFDLHAMIFSKNAPELESLLHKEFNDRRINKVNFRKEYFNVTLDEIEQVVKDKYEKEVDFIKISEAQQFRETQSIIKQIEKEKKRTSGKGN